jgi:hypothetical protein
MGRNACSFSSGHFFTLAAASGRSFRNRSALRGVACSAVRDLIYCRLLVTAEVMKEMGRVATKSCCWRSSLRSYLNSIREPVVFQRALDVNLCGDVHIDHVADN